MTDTAIRVENLALGVPDKRYQLGASKSGSKESMSCLFHRNGTASHPATKFAVNRTSS